MEHVVNDAVHQALALLAIDSPSGYTGKAAEYAYNQLKELGFDPQYSRKGAVLVNLTPHLPQEDGLLLELRLPCSVNGSTNPALLQEALKRHLGLEPYGAITRKCLLLQDFSPLR